MFLIMVTYINFLGKRPILGLGWSGLGSAVVIGFVGEGLGPAFRL